MTFKMHLYVDYVLVNSRILPNDTPTAPIFYLTLIMVTTRAGHAKKISGAELDTGQIHRTSDSIAKKSPK